jgi:Uma2 family endonuclease
MSFQPVQELCTVEHYLVLERASEERHEYLDGRLYAMAGESPEHGTICTNLTMLIASQLRGTPCQAWAKDTKVRSGPTPRPRQPPRGMFSYPDVVVVCGEPHFHDQYRSVDSIACTLRLADVYERMAFPPEVREAYPEEPPSA